MENGNASMRPYMLRAVFSWCVDSGLTPYVTVSCSPLCIVPEKYIRGGLITLNVSPTAVQDCLFGNHALKFQARFGGEVEEVFIPVGRVVAIYARENGQGMHFSPEDDPDLSSIPDEEKWPAQKPVTTKKSWLRVIQ